MKPNSKHVSDLVQAYILSCIDVSDYTEDTNPDTKTKLELVYKEFDRVALYPNNIRYHKTVQACFIDWLLGMPGIINIEVYNSVILGLMSSWGLPLPANKDESDGIELFYYLIYMNFNRLCRKHKANI